MTNLPAGHFVLVTDRAGPAFLLSDYEAVSVITKTFNPRVLVPTVGYLYCISTKYKV